MSADNTERFITSKKLRQLISFGYIMCSVVSNNETIPVQNYHGHIDPNAIIYITLPYVPMGSFIKGHSFIASALKAWIIGNKYITLEFNDGATIKLQYKG